MEVNRVALYNRLDVRHLGAPNVGVMIKNGDKTVFVTPFSNRTVVVYNSMEELLKDYAPINLEKDIF